MMATSRCIAPGQRARQRSVPSLMAVRRRELRAEARGEAETWVRLPPSPTWIHSPVGSSLFLDPRLFLADIDSQFVLSG